MISSQPTGKTTNAEEQHGTTQSSNNPKRGLKPAQRRAAERLAGGGRVADAARDAGVHRNTIGRWLGEPEFVDELHRLDGQMRQAARSRVFALADRAADNIEYAIVQGDSRLALQLLKSLEVFGRDRIRPSDVPQHDCDLFARLDIERCDLADETPADDPNRYGPILGNLDPEDRDAQPTASDMPLASGPAAQVQAVAEHAATPVVTPSLGFAMRCIAAWFAMHYSALLCTIVAIFAGFSMVHQAEPTARRPVANRIEAASERALATGDHVCASWQAILADAFPVGYALGLSVPKISAT